MKSLRRRLVVSILAGVGAVLLVSGAAVYAIARAGMRARFDEALVARARTFAAMVVEEPRSGTEQGGLVFEYFGSLREADLGVLVRVSTGDGKELARSPEFWPPEELRELPRVGDPPALREMNIGRAAARGAAVSAVAMRDPEDVHAEPAEPTPSRTAVVQVIARTEELEETEATLAWALLVGGIAGLLGAAAAVWNGVRRGLAPLARLRDELTGVDPSAPTAVSGPESYPDELRPVVATLGDLLQRLRAVMNRERRFTDAAAHELRTPIAELRTIVDVARRWPDEERIRRGLAEVGAVVEETEALLEVLLAAARGGAAYAGQKAEVVALLPMAREIAARVPARRIAWTFEGDETASWRGPRAAIAAVVRNLVHNAQEYTPEGGSVRVSVKHQGVSVSLCIRNEPVDLRPTEVEQMFEPFWRGDSARSNREHRGLGLSIVSELCSSLGLRREARVINGAFEIEISA